MKKQKKFVVLLGLAACCLLLASNAFGQATTSPVNFAAAGSSAMWQTFGIAARVDNANGGTTTQGNCFPAGGAPPAADNFHIWSGKSTSGGADKRAILRDLRGGVSPAPDAIPDTKGNVWVVWDDTAHPNKNICVYVNLDSGVGIRGLFAYPQATIILPAVDNGVAGDNLIATNLLNGQVDEVLPSDIFTSINLASGAGTPINVAMSDVRADDAYFAHLRVFFSGCTSGTCLAYPETSPGIPVQAAVGGTQGFADGTGAGGVLVAAGFELAGTAAGPCTIADPVSGQCIPGPIFRMNTVEIGAAPVVVFVNKSNNAAGHLGDATLTNVNSFTLAGALDSTLSHTADLFTNYVPGFLANIPLNVFVREPISGTYNTMEFSVVRSRRIQSTQENGNIPAADCPGGSWLSPLHGNRACTPITNPLVVNGLNGGGSRKRAIGTGNMVNAVNSVADSLGYAFWSFGNFNGKANLKYLLVDGLDPIQTGAYTGGLPQCPAPASPNFCTGILTGTPFGNVANGTYPIYTILNAVTIPSVNPASLAAPLIAASQSVVINKVPDYIPFANLNIFKAHWTNSYAGIYPRNSHCALGAGLLSGMQMGGASYPIQADFDSCADNNTELIDIRN